MFWNVIGCCFDIWKIIATITANWIILRKHMETLDGRLFAFGASIECEILLIIKLFKLFYKCQLFYSKTVSKFCSLALRTITV